VLLKALNSFFDDFFLIVKQTKFEESISLSWFVSFLIGNCEELFQMLNSFLDISVLRMRLCQLPMSLCLL